MSVHPLDGESIPIPDDAPPEVTGPLLDAIATAEREMVRLAEEAASRIEALNSELRRAVLNLALTEGADPELRMALAARLYWQHPNVAVGDIVTGFGFGNSNRLVSSLPALKSGFDCERCGVPLLAESRKRLRDLRSAPKASTLPHRSARLCQRCQAVATERYYDPGPEEAQYDYDIDMEPDYRGGLSL
jgi:hypothetical protein